MNRERLEIIDMLRKDSMLLIALAFLGSVLGFVLIGIYEFGLVPKMKPFPYIHLLSGMISITWVSYCGDLVSASWYIDKAVEVLGSGGEDLLEQELLDLKQAEQESRLKVKERLQTSLTFHAISVIAELVFVQSAYSAVLFLFYLLLHNYYQLIEGRFRRKLEDVLPIEAV